MAKKNINISTKSGLIKNKLSKFIFNKTTPC